tara:strand:- start:3471 stop:4922 length:1452 start_codon:yes stop_codon:yes gene_type:complete
MKRVSDWASSNAASSRRWLILGKGPTLRKFRAEHAEQHAILALNHVVRQTRCDVSLMMDMDVFEACADEIDANAKVLFMPWHPHVDFRPTSATLEDFIAKNPKLAKLNKEGRLFAFNAETGRDFEPLAGEPVTSIKFFSAEAGLNVLAASGARHIRTLGVDGGKAYDATFDDLNEVTLLANGRDDFDKQFSKFAETLRRYPDLLFGPLNMQIPVRIFIGSDETQLLGAKMFEYSVRRYASISTRFDIIDNAGLPVPKDELKQARTGFSFCRFKIPELCGYKGRAIYVDADMQVFTDIRDLWSRDFKGAWMLYSEMAGADGRIPQYSVMLMDCASLDWDAGDLIRGLDEDRFDYGGLMWEFSMMPPEKKQPYLEFEWNSLEQFVVHKTKLIHYTDMPTQPWVSHNNKNGEIWYEELRHAVKTGFVIRDEIDEAIDKGHVSPQLPQWAGLKPYPKADEIAKTWEPPFRRFAKQVAAGKAKQKNKA